MKTKLQLTPEERDRFLSELSKTAPGSEERQELVERWFLNTEEEVKD